MQSPPRSSLKGLRLLVVDDELLIAMLIETLLEDLGCEVVGPVATIEDAIVLVRSERLDGVLLDANLNEKSSAPVAAELCARSIPFIVVTGYGQLKLVETLERVPRLTKPFSEFELQAVLTATFLT